MALTFKQEKYVQELIKGKSQRQAYMVAYPSSKKWKDNIIDSKASTLLKNEKVRARYDELRGKVVKRAEEKAIITAEEIIREITDIAKDNVGNYLSFSMKSVLVGFDSDGNQIREDRVTVDIKDSAEVDTKNISEISIAPNGAFKFKLYERDKALFKLAEMYGVNELSKAKQRLAEERFEHEKEIDGKKYW